MLIVNNNFQTIIRKMQGEFFIIFSMLLASVTCCQPSVPEIAEKPVVNCAALAKEQNKNWRIVTIPHETDCTKFYQCTGTGSGLAEQRCADIYRTRYDPYQGVCEWNSRIDCITYGQWIKAKAPKL